MAAAFGAVTRAEMLLPASEPELQEQLMRLLQERRELQDYAERVTRELRRYQQARPALPPRADDEAPLPPWATNMQMMSPLLFAYEERIAELEAVIERSVSLAEQAQVLARENDSLRVELQERTEQLRVAQLLGPTSGRGVPGNDRQDELEELYSLNVEQNEALAQQNQLLKLQLERMQQSLLVGQQQAREVHARAWEGSKTLNAERERAEALGRQRSAVEQRLVEITAELVEEVRGRESLQTQVESLRHELRVQNQGLEHQRRSFEARYSQSSSEEERLKVDLEMASRSEKEQRHTIVRLEQALSEVSGELHVTRRDGQATKLEAEQMLKLIEYKERRLRDLSERHDAMQTKLQEHESQAADLLAEKEWWTKRQLDKAEGRLQAEAEALRQRSSQEVESMQSASRRLVADLEDQLRRSEQSAAEFIAKAEVAEKQRSWEAASSERQTAQHNAERERFKSDLEEAQQARLRLERQWDAAQQQTSRLRGDLDNSAAEAAKASAEHASSRVRFEHAEQRLAQAREEAQQQQRTIAVTETSTSRLQQELQEERLRSAELLEAERRKTLSDRRVFERQLQSVQARAHQEEHRAVELLRAQETLRLRWQAETGLERDSLEAQVERLLKENKSIKEKSRGVLKALAVRRAAGED